jgi:hypothetical protein
MLDGATGRLGEPSGCQSVSIGKLAHHGRQTSSSARELSEATREAGLSLGFEKGRKQGPMLESNRGLRWQRGHQEPGKSHGHSVRLEPPRDLDRGRRLLPGSLRVERRSRTSSPRCSPGRLDPRLGGLAADVGSQILGQAAFDDGGQSLSRQLRPADQAPTTHSGRIADLDQPDGDETPSSIATHRDDFHAATLDPG